MTADFLVIGAMKCGTSTLAAQLGAQPGIFITNPKEPNFFSDDEHYALGMDWYSALFATAAPGDLKGEASTHYTKRPDLPNTVSRMKASLSEVKLIYMIRDPMARIVSHYIHDWSHGILSAPLNAEISRHAQLVNYGRYGWQITPFVEVFGTDTILLTSLERMMSDPQGELERVARHIGFTGQVAWIEEMGMENASYKRSRKLPMHGLLVDNPLATTLRRNLVPKSIRTKIREARQFKGRPIIPVDMRPELQALFLEDRRTLERFFPGDPSLDLAYPFAA